MFEMSLGSIDFTPGTDAGGDWEWRVYGLTREGPTPIVSSVESQIRDGSIERVTGFENRTISFLVGIKGDGVSLSDAEKVLYREVRREVNEFRWTPPDGMSATAVHRVLWANCVMANEADWDLDEPGVLRPEGERFFTVTLRCEPFARSVDEIEIVGVTSGATPTTATVTDASSTANWSATGPNGEAVAVGSDGSEVWCPVLYDTYGSSLTYAPSSPVDMSATQFLTLRWRFTEVLPGAGASGVTVEADGLALTRVAHQYVGSHYVTTYICPDASVAQLRIVPPGTNSLTRDRTDGKFRVDKITRTNQAPSSGTLRQKMTSLEIEGSARMPGSLSVSHPTSALGTVLVYTSPDLGTGYQPNAAQYGTVAATADAAMVSGGYRSIFTAKNFDIPTALLPRGSYQIVARLRKSTTGALNVTTSVATRLGSSSVAPTQTVVKRLSWPVAGTWVTESLGAFTLPPADVPMSSSASVRVTVQADDGADLDELWPFYLPDDESCSLSIVPCGSGTPAAGGSSNRLWLDSASLDQPFPAAYVGTLEDRSDSRAADGASSAWVEHYLEPGAANVFVVTPQALDALVTFRGTPCWLYHPSPPRVA